MDKEFWIALIIIAAGTFLMRCLPLLYMQRHLQRKGSGENDGSIPVWLSVLGPMMIAAMLGTSLVPSTSSAAYWLATALGLIVTFCIWKRTRSLGWPILVGVSAFGTLYILLNTILTR